MGMRYVVRVVLPKETKVKVANLIECLGEADLVYVHRMDRDGTCFDVLPHDVVDTKEWSESLAGGLSALGYNAVCAPEWPREGDGPPYDAATATGMYDYD